MLTQQEAQALELRYVSTNEIAMELAIMASIYTRLAGGYTATVAITKSTYSTATEIGIESLFKRINEAGYNIIDSGTTFTVSWASGS